LAGIRWGCEAGDHDDPPTGRIVNGPELIKRETAIRPGVDDFFDPVQFGVTVRVVRFLPGLGPLDRDLMIDQGLSHRSRSISTTRSLFAARNWVSLRIDQRVKG
jgi:hypothetical protein